jgi:hypothetical protein
MNIRGRGESEIYNLWSPELIWGCTAKDQGRKPESDTSHEVGGCGEGLRHASLVQN